MKTYTIHDIQGYMHADTIKYSVMKDDSIKFKYYDYTIRIIPQSAYDFYIITVDGETMYNDHEGTEIWFSDSADNGHDITVRDAYAVISNRI